MSNYFNFKLYFTKSCSNWRFNRCTFPNNKGRKITCIVGTADGVYYSITNLFQRYLPFIITSIKMAMNILRNVCNILCPSYKSKLTAYKIRGGTRPQILP